MDEDFRSYRRRLPHWRFTGATYFVTWRLKDDQPDLSPEEREVVTTELRSRQSERYNLHAYVVMNDHVHVLLEPNQSFTLEKIIHSWKSFTTHTMQRLHHRRGALWQSEYLDRIIRDDNEFTQKLHYILHNPWTRWPDLQEYSWAWSRYRLVGNAYRFKD
jgi:REP element-mobilizing transposase RayT